MLVSPGVQEFADQDKGTVCRVDVVDGDDVVVLAPLREGDLVSLIVNYSKL